MTPQRIQLRRTKGWRKPEGAVVVTRPSRFGNPFRVVGSTVVVDGVSEELFWAKAFTAEGANDRAVTYYRKWLRGHYPGFCIAEPRRKDILENLAGLAGKDLACWCPLDQPCHADVLLELANPGWTP